MRPTAAGGGVAGFPTSSLEGKTAAAGASARAVDAIDLSLTPECPVCVKGSSCPAWEPRALEDDFVGRTAFFIRFASPISVASSYAIHLEHRNSPPSGPG